MQWFYTASSSSTHLASSHPFITRASSTTVKSLSYKTNPGVDPEEPPNQAGKKTLRRCEATTFPEQPSPIWEVNKKFFDWPNQAYIMVSRCKNF